MKNPTSSLIALAVLGLGICALILMSLKDRADEKRYDAIVDCRSTTYRMTAYLDGFDYKDVPDIAINAAYWELQREKFDPNSIKLAIATLIEQLGEADASHYIYVCVSEAHKKYYFNTSQAKSNLDILEDRLPKAMLAQIKDYVVHYESNYYWMSRYVLIQDIINIVDDDEDHFNRELENWFRLTDDITTKKLIISVMPTRQLISRHHHKILTKEQIIAMAEDRQLDPYDYYRLLESGGFTESELKAYVHRNLKNIGSAGNLFRLFEQNTISKSTLLRELNNRRTANLCNYMFTLSDEIPITYSEYLKIIFNSIKGEEDYYTASQFIENTAEHSKLSFQNLLYESKGWIIK